MEFSQEHAWSWMFVWIKENLPIFRTERYKNVLKVIKVWFVAVLLDQSKK